MTTSPDAQAPAEEQIIERSSSPIYTTSGLNAELNQAEILSNVAQYTYNPATGRATEVYHKFVIVASQDCDLAQGYEDPKTLNGILLYEAFTEEEVRASLSNGSKEWDRIAKNQNERFQFIEASFSDQDLAGIGVSSLTIDFKRFFSVPPDDLYRQCRIGHGALRRCRLASPYREHFQSRLAFYLQRVMLPLTHRKNFTAPNPQAAQVGTTHNPRSPR